MPAADDRRELLVDALKRVIAQEGWDGATVARIAREAGLAAGLVHYYFPRKLDLLLALVARLERDLAERIVRRQGGLRDPGARLEALVEACLDPGEGADPAAVRCFVAVGAQAARDPEVAAAWRSAVEVLRGAFAEALAAGGNPDPGAAAGLVAAVLGAWQVPDLAPPGWAAPAVGAMARGLLP